MTHLKFFFVAALCVTVFCNIVYGQGCSDAGFCTINGFKPNGANTSDTVLSQVKVGVFSGKADHRISVFGGYLEYNRQLNSKFGLDTKLTTMAQIGNNISAFGLGDIYVNANFKASDRILFTLGTKLPLTKADKTKDERPLPMDYQSSLGTIDVIFGIGYTISKLQLVAAIQQPITQNNNQFIAENYPSESPLSGFQSTINLKEAAMFY